MTAAFRAHSARHLSRPRPSLTSHNSFCTAQEHVPVLQASSHISPTLRIRASPTPNARCFRHPLCIGSLLPPRTLPLSLLLWPLPPCSPTPSGPTSNITVSLEQQPGWNNRWEGAFLIKNSNSYAVLSWELAFKVEGAGNFTWGPSDVDLTWSAGGVVSRRGRGSAPGEAGVRQHYLGTFACETRGGRPSGA